MTDTLKMFCGYAPQDRDLMARFYAHIRWVLKPQGIAFWYAENILPGQEWKRKRDSQLHTAHITLFLVSPDFISSDEHIYQEVLPAIEREKRGETRVLPIILRPIHWQDAPLGERPSLPENGEPVSAESWHTCDLAFFNIVSSLKQIIDQEKTARFGPQESSEPAPGDPSERKVAERLEQIIQNFRALRQQIANFAALRAIKGFSLENCANQYNRLYGDTLVFLATYLPACLSDSSDGFIEMVYRKMTERQRKRGDAFVITTRLLLSYLAKLEKLADQIDACIATLEIYRQQYFPPSKHAS